MADNLPVQETRARNQELRQDAQNWDEIVPNIFTDGRFYKTSRARYQIEIEGVRAGIIVAWKPVEYDNFGLNAEDKGRLFYMCQQKDFAAGLVVLASIDGAGRASYVDHRTIAEVDNALRSVPPRKGPRGDYWLLRSDFLPLDAQPGIPF